MYLLLRHQIVVLSLGRVKSTGNHANRRRPRLAVLVGVECCHEMGLDKRQVIELAHGEQTKGVAYFCSSGFDSQIDG